MQFLYKPDQIARFVCTHLKTTKSSFSFIEFTRYLSNQDKYDIFDVLPFHTIEFVLNQFVNLKKISKTGRIYKIEEAATFDYKDITIPLMYCLSQTQFRQIKDEIARNIILRTSNKDQIIQNVSATHKLDQQIIQDMIEHLIANRYLTVCENDQFVRISFFQ